MEEKRPDEMEMAAQENEKREKEKNGKIIRFIYKMYTLSFSQVVV